MKMWSALLKKRTVFAEEEKQLVSPDKLDIYHESTDQVATDSFLYTCVSQGVRKGIYTKFPAVQTTVDTVSSVTSGLYYAVTSNPSKTAAVAVAAAVGAVAAGKGKRPFRRTLFSAGAGTTVAAISNPTRTLELATTSYYHTIALPSVISLWFQRDDATITEKVTKELAAGNIVTEESAPSEAPDGDVEAVDCRGNSQRMCAIINKIAKQASHTFRFGSSNSYGSHFEKLIKLTKSLKATDVGLSPNGDDIALAPFALFAPVCHINILECEQFSFGIFIIRKGMALPLHDHPGMTGIVKVLYGTLKVTSYKAKNGPLSMEEHSTLNRIPVTRLPDATITSSSDCQVLTPHVGNFHFVQSMGEDTAIFDILAPPYSDNRDCHYYREIYLSAENDCFGSELSVDDASLQPYLIRVSQPYDFYCDQLPYKGPAIEVNYEDEET